MPCHPTPFHQAPAILSRPLQVDLGYERVKVGPTSNFVGNHMTQGAIDLVQAQLEQPAAPPQLLLLDDAAARESRPAPPQLLHAGAAAAGAAAERAGLVLRQLQQYRWADAGNVVTVDVPVAQMQELSSISSSGSSGTTASISCTIMRDSLELAVTVGCQAGAGGDVAASSGQAVSHRLVVRPLHAAVLPGRCRCYLRGLAAPPPCKDSGTASALAPCSSREAAAAPAGEAPPEQQQTINFILPPTAEAIVVQLAKADGQLQWEALQASVPLAVVPTRGGAGGGGAGQPDLAALRWVGRRLV
jgi:hypothetical protein